MTAYTINYSYENKLTGIIERLDEITEADTAEEAIENVKQWIADCTAENFTGCTGCELAHIEIENGCVNVYSEGEDAEQLHEVYDSFSAELN